MSDNGGGDERWRDAPPPQSRQPEPTRAERRADAKAEKARAKAMRPWYRKKRFAIPLGLVVLVVVMSALGGGEDGSQVAETSAGRARSNPSRPRSRRQHPRMSRNRTASRTNPTRSRR